MKLLGDKRIDAILAGMQQEIYGSKSCMLQIHEEHKNPFQVLIACVLSQRTKDETTDAAAKRLFSLALSPQEMLSVSKEQIEKAIYPVGFYKTKTKRILQICKILHEELQSKVPKTADGLMALPGVGRKTAGIVMVYGHGVHDACIPTDSHVFQISNRLGWVKERTPEKTEQSLMQKIPKKYWGLINELFVMYGKKICTPLSPHCSSCRIKKHCKKVGVKRYR